MGEMRARAAKGGWPLPATMATSSATGRAYAGALCLCLRPNQTGGGDPFRNQYSRRRSARDRRAKRKGAFIDTQEIPGPPPHTHPPAHWNSPSYSTWPVRIFAFFINFYFWVFGFFGCVLFRIAGIFIRMRPCFCYTRNWVFSFLRYMVVRIGRPRRKL